jgi:hypothetical protein
MSTTVARSLDDLRRDVAGKRRTATAAVTWAPEARSSTGELRVSGFAAVFDSESEDLGFIETLAPSCFTRALTRPGSDPYLLLGHDSNAILARRSAGTLELREDAHGLAFTADIVPTTQGKDVALLVKTGHLSGCSFGFTVAQDEWSMRNGTPHRRVTEIGELFEITLTGNPAYKAASVRDRRETKAELTRRIERTVARHRLNRPTMCPYTSDPEQSYFRDLTSLALETSRRSAAIVAGVDRLYGSLGDPGAMRDNLHGGVPEARARLAQLGRHLTERRDLTTSTTDGGGFVPTAPVHVAAAFAASVRARGTLPSVLPVEPLPERGMTIATPRITTGLDADTGTTENTGPSTADLVEERTTIPVSMIRGYEDVSTQLLERADPGIDEVIAVELGRSLAEQLDTLLFSGSGVKPYLLGIDAVIGIATTVFNDASPTQAEAWAKIVTNAAAVAAALGEEPDLLLLHPRRHAWVFASAWSSAPLNLPYGMRAVPCATITTVAGASTNEDRIYCLASREMALYLAAPVFEVMIQTDGLSDTLTARCIARQYASALFARRPEAIGVIAGTGLTPPSF